MSSLKQNLPMESINLFRKWTLTIVHGRLYCRHGHCSVGDIIVAWWLLMLCSAKPLFENNCVIVNTMTLNRPWMYLWIVSVAFPFICRNKILFFRIELDGVVGAQIQIFGVVTSLWMRYWDLSIFYIYFNEFVTFPLFWYWMAWKWSRLVAVYCFLINMTD
jgi:hypothetical protein